LSALSGGLQFVFALTNDQRFSAVEFIHGREVANGRMKAVDIVVLDEGAD
jgi:hypothetical protein